MWLLVPIKAYHLAKQRLAGLLPPDERSALAAAMASDLLDTVIAAANAERVIVCSNDPAVAAMARSRGLAFEQEAGGAASLAEVVNAAVARLAALGAGDMATVHGDLPLLTPSELDEFVTAHRNSGPRAMTIAPDYRRRGTNLLAWRPLAEFSTHYGEDSFQRHCQLAQRAGMSVTVCELPGAARDIDEPSDLRALALVPGLQHAPATQRWLNAAHLISRLSDTGGYRVPVGAAVE